jgi:hypothetical protein
VEAAAKLALSEVPVHIAHELTPEQAKGYRLADNRLNQLSEWNIELLASELGELKMLDVDLNALVFNNDELANLFGTNLSDGSLRSRRNTRTARRGHHAAWPCLDSR